jgi:hypothetical protein
MSRRIVKITNTYDGSEKWKIQWRVPLFGWWWFEHDYPYEFNSIVECEKEIMKREKAEAKEIVKVERT